jgi:hypothetical protein
MPNEKQLVIETPDMHTSERMQAYISQEIGRPCKQWIHQVISAKRETERIRLRTDQFVLLPDVECINKAPGYIPTPSATPSQPFSTHPRQQEDGPFPVLHPVKSHQSADGNRFFGGHQPNNVHLRERERAPRTPRPTRSNHPAQIEYSERRWRMKRSAAELHWLAVVTDPTLRTVRDLRGHHIPMLTHLYYECCKALHKETGIPSDQIIAYVHYPPSVYQLHVHFKHPISSHASYDAFRMHSLPSIINNLRINPDYYAMSHILLPVYQHTELFTALGLKDEECNLYHTTMPVDEQNDTNTNREKS